MKAPFDVAVVGSGPAGAATALRLARAGASVALIDRREFPREKLCGEYLNLGALRELQDLGLNQTLLPISQPLDGLRLYAHDECAEFRLPAQAWSIPRTILDAQLRDAALQAGAHALHGRVRTLCVDGAGVKLEWCDVGGELHQVRAKYVAGADGMQSTVARLCGLTAPHSEKRFAVGAHYRGLELGRWIEMYAGSHEYVALNPVDRTAANAVFVLNKERLTRSKGHLYEELTDFSRVVTAGRRALFAAGFVSKCHAIGPLAHRTVRPTSNRVLLVGDAAAFLDPFTGQGVYLAMAGARDAAGAIVRCLHDPSLEQAAWRDYAAAIAARLAERRRVAIMMKLMLAFRFAARRAARALRSRPHDFAFLIDAVCAHGEAPDAMHLAASVARVLR
jgi:flavin-dependent dehydrogenase